jgi:hypothetical protein
LISKISFFISSLINADSFFPSKIMSKIMREQIIQKLGFLKTSILK